MKILLVEDEPLIRNSLAKMLKKRGANVESCSSGSEAISILHRERFDRIVCDLMLQDISGFDVLEESKKFYSKDEISQIFIIITAYCSPQVLHNAEKYRCKILPKPFDEIDEALNEIMSKG